MLAKYSIFGVKVIVGLAVLILIVPALLIGLAALGSAYHYTYDGENSLEFVWLPTGSRNVYCRGNAYYRIYNFNIGEKEFSNWSKRMDVPLNEISEPISVKIYLYFDENKNFKGLSEDKIDQLLDKTSHNIKHGLFGEHRQDNGGGYTVSFDRDISTGYVEWSSH
jgi:hypothetical protein